MQFAAFVWLRILIAGLTLASLQAQFANEPRVVYATYLGAAKRAPVLAVDSAGNAFVAGGSAGGCDIAKINPAGSEITCVNVPSAGSVVAVALDSSEAIYVLGNTQNGARVVKLSPDGSQVRYSSNVIAGARATALVVDAAGLAYLAGTADSNFVPTVGAFQTKLPDDVSSATFALKVNTAGTVEYATYDGDGSPSSIAVDSQGQLWIAGAMPVIVGFPSHSAEASFVDKLDATGSRRLFSRVFGAGLVYRTVADSHATAVAVDIQGAAYVVGSGAVGVPVTAGVLQPNPPPLFTWTGYLVKFAPSGDVIYGTYLGEAYQAASAVTADDSGNAYVALFGARPAQDSQCPFGSYSSAIEVLNPTASAVLARTYIRSGVNQLSLDSNGSIYAVGTTDVTNFFATPGAYQVIYPGSGGATTAARVDMRHPSSEPELTCAVNAAGSINNPFGAVAPGEILTIIGKRLPSNIGVTFDGVAAPILYSDSNQINIVVPFEVAPSTTHLRLETGQASIGPFTMPVSAAVPAIFQNAIVNEDGTVNSTAHPAKRGSVVTVYMSGLGLMTPTMADGALGPLAPPFAVPVLGVGASVGMLSIPTPDTVAEVLFAGQAPGLIAGAVQINVRVPPGAALSSSPPNLFVYVGNYLAQRPIAIEQLGCPTHHWISGPR